jgi:hypothetical protein
MEDVYLKDIKHEYHPKENVCEWEFLEIKDSESRIYFKPNKDKGLGFDFYAINKTGHVCNEQTEKDRWDKEYCMVECVFRGIAYFDGIRHLYYGDEKTENYGYHYYADLEMIADTVKGLRELEKKYCRDYNG